MIDKDADIPDRGISVTVVATSLDYLVVLDNAGSGVVLAEVEKPAAAMALASHLRALPPADLADLWERS